MNPLVSIIIEMPFQDILTRHKDIGGTKYRHEILVSGSNFDTCKKKVLHFFQNYQLVRYSHINILEEDSVPASSPVFLDRVEKAILKNRRTLHDLIKELQGEGVITLDDLQELPQGYKSKMLHTVTHFLDGFFGIDTYFYNLGEDSHWVSEELHKKIEASPYGYWLLALEADLG
jgi:hypothetical protein